MKAGVTSSVPEPFAHGNLNLSPPSCRCENKHQDSFLQDGPDATVSVEEDDGFGSPSETRSANQWQAGCLDPQRLSTQLLLAHLPMLARPGAKDALFSASARASQPERCCLIPFEQITVADNCEPSSTLAGISPTGITACLADARVQALA